jgi:methyl-accepting chemotaxis protein
MEATAHAIIPAANENAHGLRVVVHVTDPEVAHEIQQRGEGPEREAYTRQALRIGVLALRQANGALDATTIQREGERMLASVRDALSAHTTQTTTALSSLLGGYFDPASGSLPQRLDRLTKRDGEFETMLTRHLDGERSTVAQTLARKVGEESPLFKMLSPTEAGGLVATLSRGIEKALEVQRDAMMRKLAPVLDETRSVVDKRLTLDDKASPLSRMREELMGAVAAIGESSTQFHGDVRATLEAFRVRREEAARSSAHGHTFEYAAGEVLTREAQQMGDVCERLSGTPGREGRKTGDYVITMGPDSAAPGVRIVCECKAERGYSEPQALAELSLARKNREAQIGIFVVARESATEGFEGLRRVGMDILVVWDAECPASDLYLKAAVSIARALVIQQHAETGRTAREVREIEQSVRGIERLVVAVDAVAHDAQLVVKRGTKIGKAAQGMRARLEEEMERLRGVVEGMGDAGGGGEEGGA